MGLGSWNPGWVRDGSVQTRRESELGQGQRLAQLSQEAGAQLEAGVSNFWSRLLSAVWMARVGEGVAPWEQRQWLLGVLPTPEFSLGAEPWSRGGGVREEGGRAGHSPSC